MARNKERSGRKRKRKLMPAALGAAGLSLSMASGACAAAGANAVDAPPPTAAASSAVTLAEEEIADVSLATFHVFGKEAAGALRVRTRLAMAAACGGCAGCGFSGCWTGTNYTSSIFGGGSAPAPPAKPAHKRTHARKSTQKNG